MNRQSRNLATMMLVLGAFLVAATAAQAQRGTKNQRRPVQPAARAKTYPAPVRPIAAPRPQPTLRRVATPAATPRYRAAMPRATAKPGQVNPAGYRPYDPSIPSPAVGGGLYPQTTELPAVVAPGSPEDPNTSSDIAESDFGVLGTTDVRGLRILRVSPDGPLGEVVEPGDVITQVNGVAIRSAAALDRELQAAGGFADLEVIDRDGNVAFRRFGM